MIEKLIGSYYDIIIKIFTPILKKLNLTEEEEIEVPHYCKVYSCKNVNVKGKCAMVKGSKCTGWKPK